MLIGVLRHERFFLRASSNFFRGCPHGGGRDRDGVGRRPPGGVEAGAARGSRGGHSCRAGTTRRRTADDCTREGSPRAPAARNGRARKLRGLCPAPTGCSGYKAASTAPSGRRDGQPPAHYPQLVWTGLCARRARPWPDGPFIGVPAVCATPYTENPCRNRPGEALYCWLRARAPELYEIHLFSVWLRGRKEPNGSHKWDGQ
jgi:hypothetical protein